MKKLLILLLLSLGFMGSAYAGDVYTCEHGWTSVGPLGYRTNNNPPDITMIVERSKVTILQRNTFDGEIISEVFKIEKKTDREFTAMKKPEPYEIKTLHFLKPTGSFYMSSIFIGITAHAGECTFQYRQ